MIGNSQINSSHIYLLGLIQFTKFFRSYEGPNEFIHTLRQFSLQFRFLGFLLGPLSDTPLDLAASEDNLKDRSARRRQLIAPFGGIIAANLCLSASERLAALAMAKSGLKSFWRHANKLVRARACVCSKAAKECVAIALIWRCRCCRLRSSTSQ